MNEQVKEKILETIEAYETVIVSRHIRPDGDAVGASMGLTRLLRDTYPEKHIYLTDDDFSSYLAFCGGEDEVPEEVYKDALLLVVDTGTRARISNRNYQKAKTVIKIDHHIEADPYGDINWVEDFRSSACEMIADFYLTFKDRLRISREAATYIYMGMVTDSGRFRFEGVTGETLRLAGALLDCGVDYETLFAHLYSEEPSALKFKSYVYENIRITEHGVAYLYMDRATQERFSLSFEDASAVVSELDGIKGSLIWVAFIENTAKQNIRVRLRSRFLGINDLAIKYHGGGHNMAAGATVFSEAEMYDLISDADELLRTYKAEHGDKI